MTGDEYTPTELATILLLAGFGAVGAVVGVIAAGSLVVAGVRAVARWVA